MKLDLNLLPVLLALHEERSVTAAALRLSIGQPSVSTALAKLRKTFEDQLFVRTAQGMQPTPRALALLEPVRKALELVSGEVTQNPSFAPASSKRNFVIASSDIGEMVLLPKILDHLSSVAPGVTLRMVTRSHSEVGRSMEMGDVDIALGYFPDLKGNNFYQQRLFTHTFVCVLRSSHPIRRTKMTLKEFKEGRHAVVSAAGRSQEVFEKFLLQRGIKRQVVLNTPHFMSIPWIVAHSDLIATMPLALAASFSKMNGLRIVKPPFEVPSFTLRQHWHRRVNHEPENRWLRSVIARLFNDQKDEWK